MHEVVALSDQPRRTERQRRGAYAEALGAHMLQAFGWRVLATNVRVGRDEIDIVAIDPGPPPELVCVEVRSATSPRFGAPEERVDRAKVGHLYRAAAEFARSPAASELGVARMPVRVDLVVVDGRAGRGAIRHLRRLEPA